MKLSYSIKPIIRDDKPVKSNGKYPIYFSVRLNKTVLKIPSAKDIEEKFWDKQSSKVKIGSGNSKLMNALLDKRMIEFNEFMLRNENLGKEVTVNMIKAFFQRKQSLSLYTFWEEQTKNFGGIKKSSTLLSYSQTLKILKEFNPSLNFGDINLDLIEQFDKHLRIERRNSDGGVYNRHKCFKAILALAVRKEIIQKNPYADFKIKPAKGNRSFLSTSEVRKLMVHDFGKQKENYRMILDMFLFACFTGIRFSDLTNLSWTNIFEDRIEFTMEKTSKCIVIPLLPVANDILKKYKAEDKLSMTVFMNLSNQYVNRELKSIMEAAGIKKKITFHCARHTFACTHIEAQTPLIYVKELLGHSSVSTTEIYAKTMQTGIFESMKQLASKY